MTLDTARKTVRARLLRRAETDAEYRLWCELRNRRLNGYKFVRQCPIGPYIADFACRSHWLILEIDGSQHADSAHDGRRTEWLNGQSYGVLRFWNGEVLTEREAVLETILAAVEGRLTMAGVAPSPDLRFAPATLSPAGKGMMPRPAASAEGLRPSLLWGEGAPKGRMRGCS